VSYHPAAADAHTPFEIPSGTPDRADRVTVLADQVATMRDGVRLVADVYLPVGLGAVPAVMLRVPYGRRTPDMAFDVQAAFFARKGYACVIQDVRGKFSSEGTFDPGVGEVDDGFDSVAWAAGEPWCDGRVGLWGESYYGFTSWAAAISGHEAIRAIAPGDIGVDRRASWFRQGALLQNTTGYWAMAMDAREYADLAAIDPWHLPLADMAGAAGLAGDFYRAILARAEDGAWWEQRGLRHRLAAVRCPVLSWGGWYDNYLGQQLADLAIVLAHHPAPETVHLMVGPWDHEGSAEHTDRAVCVPLPRTAQHRWDAYQAFFDRYLRGDDNGFGREGRVDLFTIGPNTWRHEPTWPPPAMTGTPVHLRAGGRLTFAAPPSDEGPATFTYDPLDPVPETVGRNCWALCTALADRRALDDRADILRYVSEPLAEDLELTGPVRAVLHAATSAVDTDFTVTLCDVFGDGTVNPIQDGIVRARYRNGMDAPSPVEPGAVVRYELDLFAASYVVAAGHRLRVDVSSSCFDRYDRNPNTGAPGGTSATTVVAEQAVFHGTTTPSYVALPVVGRAPRTLPA
jgi:putative CocE/NonD family hydrolase